ncbi:hypothetical protein Glove_46g27 [Diversispora epigaea]|uniref:Uncharacterized protein n=1 Tax=Diversispora epigaea TaxID=1348612 RepID=A0A397JHS1_9GLOM|nr:hypothetical protein Glove_46g27 [Diversispora epigaea]
MTEDNNNSRDRSKSMYQGTSPAIEIDYDEELANLTQRQLKSHVVNISKAGTANGKDIESILDSGGQCQVITCEKAKELGLEMDSVKPHKRIPRTKGVTLKSHITDRAISGIVKQVSGKKIQISIRQLLKIVKPEIGLEIIDLVANPDISRRKRTPCKVKRKKIILNDTTSSSSSESVSDSESDIEISE